MTIYRIIVTEGAEAEIQDVFLNLLLRSPEAAGRFQKGMDAAILSLSQMPARCPTARENGMIDRPIRQLIYHHSKSIYRIIFTVFEESEDAPAFVRILRIRHGAQEVLGSQADQLEDE